MIVLLYSSFNFRETPPFLKFMVNGIYRTVLNCSTEQSGEISVSISIYMQYIQDIGSEKFHFFLFSQYYFVGKFHYIILKQV